MHVFWRRPSSQILSPLERHICAVEISSSGRVHRKTIHISCGHSGMKSRQNTDEFELVDLDKQQREAAGAALYSVVVQG